MDSLVVLQVATRSADPDDLVDAVVDAGATPASALKGLAWHRYGVMASPADGGGRDAKLRLGGPSVVDAGIPRRLRDIR